MAVFLDIQFKLYGLTYGLTLFYGSERANSIALKVKKAFDALFVEYFTMLGGNISKPTSNAQSLLRVQVEKKLRMSGLREWKWILVPIFLWRSG